MGTWKILFGYYWGIHFTIEHFQNEYYKVLTDITALSLEEIKRLNLLQGLLVTMVFHLTLENP